MPLIKTEIQGMEQAWGLWHIRESEEELSFTAMETCPDDILHEQKRLEWLAARSLIRSIVESFGLEYNGLRKDEFGKPFLKELSHQVSLSHSFPYVAAQLSRDRPVGIDLEQPKEKLRTIAHRVFSVEEVNDADNDIVKLCIYWCAKESLYKIYGKRNLLFTDHLRIQPFNLANHGYLTGKINFPGTETIVPLEYKVMKEFIIVFTAA